jgi:hypothetical protein
MMAKAASAQGVQLKVVPAVADVYTERYLPPRGELPAVRDRAATLVNRDPLVTWPTSQASTSPRRR